MQEGDEDLNESEKRRLRELTNLAENIKGDVDTKLKKCVEIVKRLLRQGFHPIIWCRYIATSDYVAHELSRYLEKDFPGLRIISITGALSEEERREKVKELANFSQRVLVATDCLSEGINLQEHFTAVIHYDLPWNPNRLEQREGRVDRFGQTANKVKAILLYGRDNPVDGAVLDVLIRKAKRIRSELGISVPLPVDSETIIEVVLKSLFSRGIQRDQLLLFEEQQITDFHKKWDEAKEREKINRTKFAQRAIKPEEVMRELEETDSVLGDPMAVQKFVLNASQRLGIKIYQENHDKYVLSGFDQLPDTIKLLIPDIRQPWSVSFISPPPENTTFLGRNHPFVTGLAQFLLEEALIMNGSARAPRCGAIRTSAVDRRTFLLLMRLRYKIVEPDKIPMLAEEAAIFGIKGNLSQDFEWRPEDEVLSLLPLVSPKINMTQEEAKDIITEFLEYWDSIKEKIKPVLDERAKKLADSHKRLRMVASLRRRGLSVSPYFPPDLLGILALLPVPKGVD
ncbi:MAG: SWF/SNF helicase family protein [Candidatus Aminicenantes bacterium]|nr:SWF/SNF helicase family protein [Candidatus Aminicenantes bacterium]